jgi:hypothetical protein
MPFKPLKVFGYANKIMFRQLIYTRDAIQQVKEYSRTQTVSACRRVSLTEIKVASIYMLQARKSSTNK